jgi:metal-sulfur cluster biosynthetic enzyme
VVPASTGSETPVIKRASSEARKATACEMSCGVAGCLHVALFAAEIERRVAELARCRSIRVETTADELWTEERMSPALRTRLTGRRAAARA